MQTWQHLRAILLLPGIVTLLIPGLIISRTRSVQIGWGLAWPWSLVLAGNGILFMSLGLTLLYQTVRLFITRGQGTLAPWQPPQRLVVHGIYRHVRNPMISGVGSILLGESLLLGSLPLLGWFLIFMMINLIYIPLLEEPGLVRRFGEEYRLYQQHVPRWLPRLRPWQVPWDNEETKG